MNKYLSDKLRALSFVLICMVVLLHANIFHLSKDPVSIFIQNLFTSNITRVAVPFFFAISGYLLVCTLDEDHIVVSFKKKIAKRSRTLLIPYLVYNAACLLIVGLSANFISPTVNTFVLDYDVSDYLHEWLVRPYVATHMWFVKDLFLMMLFSPLILLAVRYLREAWIFCLCIVYGLGIRLPPLLGMSSLLFFSLGIYMCLYKQKWCFFKFKSPWWWGVTVLWIVVCVSCIRLGLVCYESTIRVAELAEMMVGILSLWTAYDLLSESWRERLVTADIISFTFAIYLLHLPMLEYVKRTYVHFIGIGTTISELILYFGSPLIVIIACYYLSVFLKKRVPRLYALMTGGR